MAKYFVGANEFHLDSFRLAKKIYNSGYIPNLIIGLWRGGSIVAMCIDEYFRYKKIKIPTYSLKVEAYKGINKRKKDVSLAGLGSLVDYIINNNLENILLVDDVKESGGSLDKTINSLLPFTKKFKIATVYYKPKKDKTNLKPNFYLYETNSWIVFPHELEGLTLKEIKNKNKEIYKLLTT